VWLFGAHGGLATTLVVGTRALARGLVPPRGLATELDVARGIDWQPLDGIVFGGHEIRRGDYLTNAAEIHARTGTLPPALVQPLRGDLAAASRNVVRGVMPNAGASIDELAEGPRAGGTLAAQVARVQRDLRAFRRRHRLERVVCVNLTSTEPPLRRSPAHRSLAAFERALQRDDVRAVRPSAIYAYAAAKLGLPFVHFTPSEALLPAVCEAFAASGAPWMGRDGKTGETLM
jgi:myo-inositol-1-phosphate synthase